MDGARNSQPISELFDASTHPYGSSWIDWLTNRVRLLPGPAWLFYLVIGFLLYLLVSAVKWSEGSYAMGQFSPFYAAQTFIIPYTIAMLHLLDDLAAQALDNFRPVLSATEQQYKALRHQLTTLPPGWTLLATALGVGYALLPFNRLAPLVSSSPTGTLEQTLAVLAWAGAALFIYHSVHQLSVVNLIYTQYTQIDLFKLGPLYAFSRVAAITSLAIIGGHFLYLLPEIAAGNLSSPSTINSVLFGLVGAVAFFVPLLSAHNLLVKEKQHWLDENAELMHATIQEVHHRAKASQLQGMDQLKITLDSLAMEQERLRKMPTWPWRSETLGAVVTALLLPLLLSFLEQALRSILGSS